MVARVKDILLFGEWKPHNRGPTEQGGPLICVIRGTLPRVPHQICSGAAPPSLQVGFHCTNSDVKL